jgi:hypothetical protein
MVDRDVVERAAPLMGARSVGTLKPGKAEKLVSYRARVRGKPAATLMRKLYPHLGARRQTKIDSLLEVA